MITTCCDHDRHYQCPTPGACACGCHVFVNLGLRPAAPSIHPDAPAVPPASRDTSHHPTG